MPVYICRTRVWQFGWRGTSGVHGTGAPPMAISSPCNGYETQFQDARLHPCLHAHAIGSPSSARHATTVGMRGYAQELGKLEIEFGPKTGPRIKMFYTRSIRLVLN
jgi:hypothetical protein